MQHSCSPWAVRACLHPLRPSTRPVAILLASGCLLLIGETASAQGAQEPDGLGLSARLPVISITAPTPRVADRVAPHVRVTREVFAAQPSDRASDVVGRMPGIVVSGPPGEKKSFSLRGLTPDFTRVEIDGVRPPNAGQSRVFELMNLPGDQLEAVEIRRTPTARDEGDGIAGVIAVETRGVPDAPTVAVTGALGGVDGLDGAGRRLSAFAGGMLNPGFGVAGGISLDQRTITKVKDFSERTYSGGPGGQGFLRDEDEPKDFTNIDGFATIERRYDDGVLRLKPMALIERTELDKRRDQYRRVSGQFQDRTLSSATEDTTTLGLTVENEHRFDRATLDSRAVLGWTRFDSRSTETSLAADLGFSSGKRSTGETRDRLLQVGQDLTVPVSSGGIAHDLGVGYLVKHSARSSDTDAFTLDADGRASQTPGDVTTSRQSDYDIDEWRLAGYAMDTISIGRVTLSPGLRVEYVRSHLSGGLGEAAPSDFDVLPSLPITVRLTDQLAFQGGVARTVNRPKFDEIAPGITTRGQRSFFGNPDLEPARAWGVDAGLTWEGPSVFLGINGFGRSITDVIESYETSANAYEFRNVGDGWARGVEMEQRVALGGLLGVAALQPLTLWANQTFVKTEVDDPMTGVRPFADQAEVVANLGVDWDDRRRGTRLSLIANYTGDRRTISYEGAGAVRDKTRAAEWTLDLRVEQRIAEGVSLFAVAENLTDTARDEVEHVSGALNRTATITTGRSFYIGASFRF